MLWLELSPTNHDPKVIVTYYMQAVAEYGGVCVCVCMNRFVCMDGTHLPCCTYDLDVGIVIGCPTVLRCDYGTENCLLATTQMALRHGHGDTWAGLKSFKYGKSTSNTVSFKN